MRIPWEQSEDAAVVQGRGQARREKWFWMDLKAKCPAGCPERRGRGWERRGTGVSGCSNWKFSKAQLMVCPELARRDGKSNSAPCWWECELPASAGHQAASTESLKNMDLVWIDLGT